MVTTLEAEKKPFPKTKMNVQKDENKDNPDGNKKSYNIAAVKIIPTVLL